jgi:hypothetical protein
MLADATNDDRTHLTIEYANSNTNVALKVCGRLRLSS